VRVDAETEEMLVGALSEAMREDVDRCLRAWWSWEDRHPFWSRVLSSRWCPQFVVSFVYRRIWREAGRRAS